MKKMYLLTVAIIFLLTVGFLFFYCDMNTLNKRFLASYDIEVSPTPYLVEEIEIPKLFDEYYKNYNLLQLESGLNISQHKGKKGVRYTYKMTNFPDKTLSNIYVNVICIKRKPVAGDINCPSLSGFIMPLSYISTRNAN